MLPYLDDLSRSHSITQYSREACFCLLLCQFPWSILLRYTAYCRQHRNHWIGTFSYILPIICTLGREYTLR
ncbi:hypothetical protein T440DRAFT_1054 [Plenodomus tracheiphilus IPT5]|uniref:Uncharacterized protein n=1 Tax=Plenodomus tracheiphilus IPT5 TaxID=1408161 RepID=A0A6A7BM46_9PLEO|nr:hypothetical protein T440DRAFT_1054 [Plenodomus tracheiphilus IPT5]